jgi:nickel-dependent lactate racemase
MTTHIAIGSPSTVLADEDLRRLLTEALARLGTRRKVLAVPPDFTRGNSRAGILTRYAYDHFGDALVDIMPALGTHVPMPSWQLQRMFAGVPESLFRVHDWRNDVVTVGTLEAEFVREATGGVYERPWPAQLNKLVWQGGHDLILSIGQVVPHEVVGMANHHKNLLVGTGGRAGINESHFVGAAYGMERMMGRAETPVRKLFTEAWRRHCRHLPVLWVLTVVGRAVAGEPADHAGLVTRGFFIGEDEDCFLQAAELSRQVNFEQLDTRLDRAVVYLDPEEFHTTWLGNKAIYRTRMAMADRGVLTVLAPGVKGFGEDPGIDRLIRRHGYRTTPEILAALKADPELADNLSAAAHLIHGSSENHFTVIYCTDPEAGGLSRAEVESVGYQWRHLREAVAEFDPKLLKDGWQQDGRGSFFYISNPALGLWAWKGAFG